MASPKNPGSVGKENVYKTRGKRSAKGDQVGKCEDYALPDDSMGNDGSGKKG